MKGAIVSTPMDKLLDAVEWIEFPSPAKQSNPDNVGIPIATHYGYLNFLGFDLKVLNLDNGTRLIDAESLEEFFKQLSTVEFPTKE